MKFSDIILSLLIIFIFLMCCLVSYLSKGFKHIQNNWPQYRCNPVIMPFAGYFGHDTEENFAQCIGISQNMSGAIKPKTIPRCWLTMWLLMVISKRQSALTNIFWKHLT